MTKRFATFKQRHFLDSLQKEMGIAAYDEVKNRLKIKKPVQDISIDTARRFIQGLIEYKQGRFKSSTIDDMNKALRNLRRNKKAFEEGLFDYEEEWLGEI